MLPRVHTGCPRPGVRSAPAGREGRPEKQAAGKGAVGVQEMPKRASKGCQRRREGSQTGEATPRKRHGCKAAAGPRCAHCSRSKLPITVAEELVRSKGVYCASRWGWRSSGPGWSRIRRRRKHTPLASRAVSHCENSVLIPIPYWYSGILYCIYLRVPLR